MSSTVGGATGDHDRHDVERRAEQLLRAIIEGTSSVTGVAFFSSLVKNLARALNVHRVYVAECLDPEHSRARAVWMENDFAPPFDYDVTSTPCLKVTQGQTCLYSNNVQQYFPQNQFLPTMNAQSYLGIPLWNSSRAVIGHMVLVDNKPMSEDPLWISVLQTFAARAGAELEREQATEKLRAALAEVERLTNQLQAENGYLQEEIRREHNFEEMVGNSPALLSLLRMVERVAGTDSTVLIQGETGVGKELIARALHNNGPRKHRPLVKVNCGAVPPGLLESELFGHVKGAFTGAIDRRTGRFELAHGGALFLDEIGELPLETQVKLLRVLQEQQFEPVGSSRTVGVDVRIIAATNRDLAEEVRAGRFRSDLFFRLNVVPLTVPPLRERAADIPLLVAFFLSVLAGLGASAILTRGGPIAPIIVIVAGAGILAEGWALPVSMNGGGRPRDGLTAPPPPATGADTPPIYEFIRTAPEPMALLEIPYADPAYEMMAVFYAGYHRKPIVNGYSGWFPRGYRRNIPALRDVLADPDRALRAIGRSQATHVLVHEGAWPTSYGRDISTWLTGIGATSVARFGSDQLFALPGGRN